MALLLQVDEELSSLPDPSLNKLSLQTQVTKLIGLKLQQKAQYNQAIDHHLKTLTL